jgi:hypothetical protein
MELRVKFFSAFAATTDLRDRYRGGIYEFDRDFPDADKSEWLRGLAYMSETDLESVVEGLEHAGLALGRDIAVADMMQGELIGCPNVRFENRGDDLQPLWFACPALNP